MILAAVVLFGGCRLYEPERYQRLRFADDSPRIKVLFVGNSLTFYNDLPGLVQQLSVMENRPVDVTAVTAPYVSLQWHWNRGKVQKLLAQEKWDYVVLQEFSRRPVTDPQNSEKYFELFAAEAQRAGAKPLIFQNWTRSGRDSEYGTMFATYQAVKQRTSAAIVPIGLAWRLCAEKHPEIELFADSRHPTDEGTYLTACVVYGAIYGKNPTELPMNLAGPQLSAETLKTLREIASAALQSVVIHH